MKAESTTRTALGMQILCLLISVSIMVGGTAYPPLLMTASGKVEHGLATLVFWSMSAGFVYGVGFVPKNAVGRWLFSFWACFAALLLAGLLKLFL
ncbi:cyd operon YbgE family protein [Undibacterium sp. RTI2.1]|uniref:cyd operon YbgE family protein n=1 Tax=unclassified Undibacterium TaxID=2630295 RepID=UPI002B230D55|nr:MULTISPECIES: cyd operon YbgE family protein [unclassified Undibacterium]MEB0032171.1 cyd operon YbgE family protein [Undibacterium sp. RTI2.1]MEB0118298.1 cyd operon YbgE family protein [Undibacterium sp. RTI2.2]